MIDPSAIRERFAAVGRGLNERTRRLFAAVEARTAGYGGIEAAAQATWIARSAIGRGLKDLNDPASLSGEVRRPGGGRPALTETDATLLEDSSVAGAGDQGRPDAAAAVGLEEPRQAGGGAVRDGASGQQEHHSQTVGVAAILPAGESQDAGKRPQSRP